MNRRRRRRSPEGFLLLALVFFGMVPLVLAIAVSFAATVFAAVIIIPFPDPPAIPNLLAVSDTGISSSDNITSVARPTFAGEGEPDSTVTVLSDARPVGSGSVRDGAFEITASGLPDGVHSIAVVAENSFDRTSDPSPVLMLTIDTAPPGYGPGQRAPGSAANANGWNNQPVTVEFPCRDNLSGPEVTPIEVVMDGEGAGLTAEAPATDCRDVAGNRADTPATLGGINIDTSPPEYGAGRRDPESAPSRAGWNQGPVTVHFPCRDNLSGPESASVPVVVAADGASQTATARATDCRDRAGNVARSDSDPVGGINIDTTPPTYGGGQRDPGSRPNSNGWNNGPVTVHFPCQDRLSGAVSTPLREVVSREGINQTVTVPASSCQDRAGNLARDPARLGDINIDTTPPAYASGERAPGSAANGNGWNQGPVTVHFPCQDSLSGPVNRRVAVTVQSPGRGQTAQAGASDCRDRAGNAARSDSTPVGGINIDSSPPAYGAGQRAPGSEANPNGWNNGTVTVRFPCQDGLSGPETAQVTVSVGAEGAARAVTAPASACQDRAGNTARSPAIVSGVKIDITPPAYGVGQRAPGSAAKANGWNNGPVTVRFPCQDSLSGPEHPQIEWVVREEGRSQAVSSPALACRDRAGNPARSDSAPVGGINIDTTPPTYGTGQRDPGSRPNSNGWNNGPVTLRFSCLDSLSGPEATPIEVEISSEGAFQTRTVPPGNCRDRAGNIARNGATVPDINIDTTPPTYGPGQRDPGSTANAAGWNHGPVTVRFPCQDTLSGAATTSVTVVVSSEGMNQSATAQASGCTDKADNSARTGASLAGINIDTTPPAYGAGQRAPGSAANANGWNNGPVTVRFLCSDSGAAASGVAESPVSVTVTANGASQSATAPASACRDRAENTARSAVTLGGIYIDTVPPRYGAAQFSPPLTDNGWFNQPVTVTFFCLDDLSRPESRQYQVTVSASQTVTAPASACRDRAGNTAVTGASVRVSIDRAPPVYGPGQRALGSEPNLTGWNNGPVTVLFPCRDDLSEPVSTRPIEVVVSGPGRSLTATAAASDCRDQAGNAAQRAGTLTGINIDTTPPGPFPSLFSNSHQPQTWSPLRNISVAWSTPPDALSQVDGYSIGWSQSPTPTLDATIDTRQGSTVSPTLPDGQSHYFHIRAIDRAGNPGPVQTLGPFWIGQSPPPVPVTLDLAVASPEQELNLPWLLSDRDLTQLRPMFEFLVDVDRRTGAYAPMLAEDWSASPNFDSWTFHLRPDVDFHGGWGKLTAVDVAHSVAMLRRQDATHPDSQFWRSNLLRIELIDDFTLRFHFRTGQPGLLRFVSARGGLVMLSKSQWDQEGDRGLSIRPAGTGPYQYVQRLPGAYIQFQRLDRHWRVVPRYRELRMRFVPESITRLAMLLTEEVDLIEIPEALHPQAEAQGMRIIYGQNGQPDQSVAVNPRTIGGYLFPGSIPGVVSHLEYVTPAP